MEKSSNLLNEINSPQDIKSLSIKQLPKLAEEIRQLITDTVSETGGHLAPSLGAVDFTIALYYCLNCPNDLIVWDVGHQAYAHKILTGRRKRFKTLRQKNGISGFPNATESIYDAFTVGHGSTSISTALGLCCAKEIEQKDKDGKIVAVIGDGSLGGGMAFEGLNHAGQLKKDILIILNDNEFSISPSVGAFSRYLNRIIANPVYNRIREDVDRLIRRVPRLGFRLSRAARKLEEGLKNLLVPGMIFEEMGIRYFGPVDGHNIEAMVEVMKNILPLKEPRMIHVITKKGKGFKLAEKNPSKFHGTAPFDISTGEPKSGFQATFTSTFSDYIIKLANKNEKIVAITAAMPEGTGLDKFEKTFPERFFNVGMAEGHAVGFAAGLAKKGLIPVVAVYSTFLQRAYDQIIHDVCLQNLKVIFCLDRAGLVGEDGPTHHGVFDISYLRHIPNLVCMAPKDMPELEAMMDFAVECKSPVAIRYPRGGITNGERDHARPKAIKLGQAEILRDGRDAAILAIGGMVALSLKAAEIVSAKGIKAKVINMRFIKPIDSDIILKTSNSVKNILIVEDNVLEGGFGSRVIEVQADNNAKTNIKRMGIPDRFIAHGKKDELYKDLGLTAEHIAQTIENMVRDNP